MKRAYPPEWKARQITARQRERAGTQRAVDMLALQASEAVVVVGTPSDFLELRALELGQAFRTMSDYARHLHRNGIYD